MTEQELSERCCIFDGRVYWKSVVKVFNIPVCTPYSYEQHATLYHIWNYEATNWWEWPQELREVMHMQVPQSIPS